MLRYALRRILWAIPTLFGISLVVFLVTTLIPDSDPRTDRPTGAPDAEELEERRRAQFLDLPRFFNPAPADARTRTEALVAQLAEGGPQRDAAAKRLARLGGAVFPHVLPRLEELSPEARGRVALALVPVAERIGLAARGELDSAPKAILFFTRLWEDRALDFTEPAVRRAVDRLVDHGSELRERELGYVDTFALPAIIPTMAETQNRVALERLARLARHATQRGPLIPTTADEEHVRRAVADWQEWWYVHQTDYVELDGAGRVAATLVETRYGRWIARTFTGHLGVSVRDGEPIAQKLLHRAPVTLLITVVAMLASYALAVPIGVLGAWRRGRAVDSAMAVVLFALYSLPTFWTAELLWRAFLGSAVLEGSAEGDVSAARLVLPTLALTVASLATLSRYQRTSTLEVIGQDYVRTARAKGASGLRLLIVHVLRNALLPTVTLAGLQLPTLLGGAFVVEEVFSVPGVGYETLRAIESRDVAWLMATIVGASLVTTLGLLSSDVAYGVLDPRVREAIARPRGARP